MRRYLLLFALVIATVSGCKKHEVSNFKFETDIANPICYPMIKDTKIIGFNSKLKWEATTSVNWISVDSANGNNGKHQIYITVEQNKTSEIRNGVVQITLSNNESYEIKIKQNPAPAEYVGDAEMPSNEIWYTTADGEITKPYGSSLRWSIVSNKYANGMGIIKVETDLTEIGYDALNFCYTLVSVKIPNSVTKIRTQGFYCCWNMINVNIPDNVVAIGSNAFGGCKSLQNITIGENVSSIAEYAFSYCEKLVNVYCKAITPPEAECRYGFWRAFDDNAPDRKIYVPTQSVEAYKSAEGWSDYADAIVGYDFE